VDWGPFSPDLQPEGGWVVTFRDIPEAITQGEDIEEARTAAADALEEAMAGRIVHRLGVPEPSEAQSGEVRRLLDPLHPSKLNRAEAILRDPSKVLCISVESSCASSAVSEQGYLATSL